MFLLSIIIVALIIYGVYRRHRSRASFFEKYGIPYKDGVPLLGLMLKPLLRKKTMVEVLSEVYDVDPRAKYVGTFDFDRPVIVLRDFELIKTVTIRNFDNCPDHVGFFSENSDPLFGGNLFNMAGERWKESRNLLSPAFTSSKMKGMFDLMTECAKDFVGFITEQPDSYGNSVATYDLFTKYTNDVIATCAYGVNVNTLRNPTNDFYVLGKKATNLDGINGLKLFLARGFPNLVKILNIRFISKEVGDFFKDIVRSTVSMRDETGKTRPDMIQLMMNARNKESKYLRLDTTEMTAQAFIFFLGGFDTTSRQSCIVAHELAINPNVQKKLQEEIDKVMEDTKGKPTYEAVNAMEYLDAVFNEAMRLHTQVFMLDRLCRKKFELPPALPGGKPVTVEPGTAIWILPAAINRDSNYHDNPDTFDPERFLDKTSPTSDATNLGFGIGPRACIGKRFAILEIKILFFFLLSKFNLRPSEKTSSPLRYSKKTLMLTADEGFWLRIEKRKE